MITIFLFGKYQKIENCTDRSSANADPDPIIFLNFESQQCQYTQFYLSIQRHNFQYFGQILKLSGKSMV
jgi:hypothetical protein